MPLETTLCRHPCPARPGLQLETRLPLGTLLRSHLGSQISRGNGFRKTQWFLRLFQPPLHLFVASLEPGIAGPEDTKTRSQGARFRIQTSLRRPLQKEIWGGGPGQTRTATALRGGFTDR